MRSCDQSLVTLAFIWEKLSQPQFYKDLTRKTAFFEGWSWFKFNNLELVLGTSLKFYTSMAKRLKLKVRKFWGLIPTFVEVTGEKLVGGHFTLPPILNRVKNMFKVTFVTKTNSNMQNSMVVSISSVLDWIATLFAKFVPKNHNCQFKLKIGT